MTDFQLNVKESVFESLCETFKILGLDNLNVYRDHKVDFIFIENYIPSNKELNTFISKLVITKNEFSLWTVWPKGHSLTNEWFWKK